MKPLRTLVVGLGQMGTSHALAYHANPGFEIVGLCNRSDPLLPEPLEIYPRVTDFEAGLALAPDVVSINTYTDTHAEFAVAAMQRGAHVFVEKPLAADLQAAQWAVDVAQRTGRKLVVGYILRHHPSWIEFIRLARQLGPPYVMRMNLNQQSSAGAWRLHKRLMETTSPIVDCGVHYVDVMLQITDARPVQVRGMGARLTSEIASDQVNFGHLQLLFEDGSIGWYEAGWGPMISETAFFVKDVISPNGSVSIVVDEADARSADVDTHTITTTIRLHRAELDASGEFARPDRFISMQGEPTHQDLCNFEQAFLLKAIRNELDLTQHMADAVRSLQIVLAADRSMRECRAIDL
jgi:predicted dehydrogenase